MALLRDQSRREAVEPSPHARKPVDARELRQYWTPQFQRWSKQRTSRSRSQRVRLPGGDSIDAFVLATAIMGLLDNMRHDGALKGPRDFWNVTQLAEYMGLRRSNHTALAILEALEKWGDMVVVKRHDGRGHRQTSERYMQVGPHGEA